MSICCRSLNARVILVSPTLCPAPLTTPLSSSPTLGFTKGADYEVPFAERHSTRSQAAPLNFSAITWHATESLKARNVAEHDAGMATRQECVDVLGNGMAMSIAFGAFKAFEVQLE